MLITFIILENNRMKHGSVFKIKLKKKKNELITVSQKKEMEVLVCDPLVLKSRLSDCLSLMCLNSDQVHTGYSNGHINEKYVFLQSKNSFQENQ